MGLILLTQLVPSLCVSFSSLCPQGTLACFGGRGIKQKDNVEVPPHRQKGDPFRRTTWSLGALFPLSCVVLYWDGLGRRSPTEFSGRAKPRPRGSNAQGLWKGEAKADFANIKGFRGPFMRLLMGEN